MTTLKRMGSPSRTAVLPGGRSQSGGIYTDGHITHSISPPGTGHQSSGTRRQSSSPGTGQPLTGHWAPVTCHVTNHRSSGHWSLSGEHQAPVSSHQARATVDYQALGTGKPGTSHQPPVTGYHSPVTGHRAPVTGHQAPVTRQQTLGTENQVANYRHP